MKFFFEKIFNFIFSNKSLIILLLFFGFIPLRVFNFWTISLELKLVLGYSFVLILFFFRKNLIPLVFNSYIFQLTMFLSLLLENVLFRFPLLLGIVCLWIVYLLPLGTFDFYSIVLALFFLVSTHFRLKFLLLNIELTDESLGLEKPEDLTWNKITQVLSFVSKKFFDREITNRLPGKVSSISFPYIVRRYMFKRAFQHMADYATVYGILGAGAGGVGGGIAFWFNYQIAKSESAARIRALDEETRRKRLENDLLEAKLKKASDEALEKLKKKVEEKPYWFSFSKAPSSPAIPSPSDGSSSSGPDIKAPSMVTDWSFSELIDQIKNFFF